MIKYVVYTDGAVPMVKFVKTLGEAMDAFDKATLMCNHFNNFTGENRYLNCAEMGITTWEQFEKKVVGMTDYVFCYTFEDYVELINEYFEDELDNVLDEIE